MNTAPLIHLAPLQGYTDNDYRETFDLVFGNIDFYYTPYYTIENNGSIKCILPKLNSKHSSKLIVQVLPATIDEFIKLVQFVVNNNYTAININAGCPYPMVHKRGRGASLLTNPKLVNSFIDYALNFTPLKISLKIRSGMESHDEIFNFLEQVDYEHCNKVIIHPRTAKQLYKGDANVGIFIKCCQVFNNSNFVYNGDITTYNDYCNIRNQLPFINDVMIGRGMLRNPLLAWQIKNEKDLMPVESIELITHFCNLLTEAILTSSNDMGHALNRLKVQFEYLFENYPDKKKWVKQLKKTRNIEDALKLMRLI